MRSALTRLMAVLSLTAGTLAGWCATSPIYINESPMQSPPAIPPQIDAAAFVNRSLFSVDQNQIFFSGSSGIVINTRPYETLNTRFFTNTSSGVMYGDPGYRFAFSTNNDRLAMDTWVNQGSIRADSTYYFFSSGGSANWLLVSASNIVSSGPIGVGSQGLLRLEGNKIDLRRNGLRAGASLTNSGFLFGSSVLSSNYINDVGIADIYWGTGTNNVLSGSGQPMNLTGFGGSDDLVYGLPFPQSPYHRVIEDFGGFSFTNIVTVPGFFGFSDYYTAAAFTNQFGPTNFSIQVVFYPTNTFDTNFFRQVRFYPEFGGGGATVVVAFNTVDFDIVEQTYFTNSIFLVDALAFETNVFLAQNLDATTSRPNTYEVTRNQPYFFSFFGATNGNTPYNTGLLYNGTYQSNQVPVRYAGYQVQVSSLNAGILNTPGGTYLYNPTNLPGRIEIVGNEVNLDQTRIRADSTLVLRAAQLTSNRVAKVDAPYVVFDVGSVEPLLVVSNIAPPAVRRLNGTVSAWSAIWRNYETNATTTNAIDFHVLIVEDALQALQPVILEEFRVRAKNLNIADTINVGRVMRLDLTGLDLGGALLLPAGSSWATTNVLNLVNLTNRGSLAMDGSASFGTDRPAAYSNFINQGSVSAASIFVRARNFENSGTVYSSGGLLSVDTLRGRLLGAPTFIVTNFFTNVFFGFTNVFTNIVTNSIGATLTANSDIQWHAQDLVVSNSVLKAGVSLPGGLVWSVTNRLVDSGWEATNFWSTTAGFNMLRKPVQSDLLGTQIRSSVASFAQVNHFWPADDLGATTNGFQNNLAVGKLILDAQSSLSLLRFSGTGANRALYVDFIQLENYATNFSTAIEVDPNLTIYFADANVAAEKLDGALDGRFRWVSSYVGTYSSTNITYPSGRTYTFNRGLVVSKDLDSDGDGTPNGLDPTPIYIADDLTIALTKEPPWLVFLSWTALGNASNRVEYKDTLSVAAPWQVLTVIKTNVTTPVLLLDPVPVELGQRFYRIRIDPFP